MPYTKNAPKLPHRSRTDLNANDKNEGELHTSDASGSRNYAGKNVNLGPSAFAVTVSRKPSASSTETPVGQKSFISIHSTDQLCQSNPADVEDKLLLEQCNVEVISLNEVFPSTSEESVSEEANHNPSCKNRWNRPKIKTEKTRGHNNPGKSSYVPTNSKSTVSARTKDPEESSPSVYSDYNIPKSTLYVTGSNPGEPKMAYQDPPKKISKTMKKFLRNIDKHKNEQSKSEKNKLMRGILKDGRCGPESTGDYALQGADQCAAQEFRLPFPMDFGPQVTYGKHQPDKNVTFNTQVVIIHFNGDLCLGQSVETLSKEKDQQARNSELRKTFLTKYNEFWPAQK